MWLRFSLTKLILVVTAICAALAIYADRRRPAAVALIQVRARQPLLLSNGNLARPVEDFATFKRTQATLVTQHFVLQAALRHSGINRLSLIQRHPDALGMLRKSIDVTFPGDSEIMQIRMVADDVHIDEAVKLVNAVQQAYLERVVFKDREERLRTKAIFERSFRELVDQTVTKAEKLRELRHEASGKPSVEINQRQRELKVLRELVDEMRMKIERMEINLASPDRIQKLQDAAAEWE